MKEPSLLINLAWLDENKHPVIAILRYLYINLLKQDGIYLMNYFNIHIMCSPSNLNFQNVDFQTYKQLIA